VKDEGPWLMKMNWRDVSCLYMECTVRDEGVGAASSEGDLAGDVW
jgi:hypothetical protein